MDHERPSLPPDVIEDLCRRYREAERSQAQNFDRCEVRFNTQLTQPEIDRSTTPD